MSIESFRELVGLPRGGRVLVLHDTDRWYFGDFLRHVGVWLPWLQRAFPGAVLDLATHPAYLPVYGEGRFDRLLEVQRVKPLMLHGYDLVVRPTAYELAGLIDEEIPRLLNTWDRGWSLRVLGAEQARGVKDELNYFRAADPASVSWPGSTPAFRDTAVDAATLRFSDAERQALARAYDEVFPGAAPVLVYNPTSSNSFTRETTLRKEVESALSPFEHATVLRHVLAALPDHRVLVAAPLKSRDLLNAQVVREVAEQASVSVDAGRVATLTDLTRALRHTAYRPAVDPKSLRGFAALLSAAPVCSMLGGGTGSNTHLAALAGVWSMSIERGADAEMRENWQHPGEFQMGSFRWRNPSVGTAVHVLDWAQRDAAALARAGNAFLCHHAHAHGGAGRQLFAATQRGEVAGLLHRFTALWPDQWHSALSVAAELLALMPPSARQHYGDFGDEAQWLGVPDLLLTEHGSPALRQLFQDSNLHKLLTLLAARHERTSEPDPIGVPA